MNNHLPSNNLPKPPQIRTKPLDWLKENLFNSWFNTILSIICLGLLYWLGQGLIKWLLFGAEWGVITANLRLFFIGSYPVDLIWRTWATLAVLMAGAGFSWGVLKQSIPLLHRKRWLVLLLTGVAITIVVVPMGFYASLLLWAGLGIFFASIFLGKYVVKRFSRIKTWISPLWLLLFFVCFWLLRGGLFLSTVPLDELSGLILTLLASIVSIVLSFPFGVLLALGRQSPLPVIRWASIAYIELIRALPLIGILFLAQVMLPLVLPVGTRPERVIRAIAGFTLFSTAYLAENVRGGLQSIPRGQWEAARALGFNTPLSLLLIILPQALKAVVPAIVGQFISLFKNTSLLAIVGLVDLVGIGQSILANPKYIGRYGEVYLFIALIYWVFCYAMSLASRQLE